MGNQIKIIDTSGSVQRLSKTSPNNELVAKKDHIANLVTIANVPHNKGMPMPGVLPMIPVPLGAKTPESRLVALSTIAERIDTAKLQSSVKSDFSDPKVNSLLSGEAPSLGSQSSSIESGASGSLEMMLQMMQLTAPSEQIKAMQNTMNSQNNAIAAKGKANLAQVGKYYKNQEAAAHKTNWVQIFGWVAAIATLVIGALVTAINPVAGVAMMVAGAFMLANQIFQATASDSFKNSAFGKALGTIFAVGAAVGSIVSAIATGGASAFAMGMAIMNVVGQVTTLSLQTAQKYDKNFKNGWKITQLLQLSLTQLVQY